MLRRKSRKSVPAPTQPGAEVNVASPSSDWADELGKLPWRKFPGPAGARAPLRVSFSKEAFGAVVAHAQGTLDREICGVLVGKAYQDEAGPFALVTAVIQGQTEGGATHVTFTQETWTQIHAELDSSYPDESIVGWYHSHPGFGVTFSDMDLFIQKNFFSSPTQIALVTDPLKNLTAALFNSPTGIQYLERIWIDGREMTLHVDQPAATEARSPTSSEGSNASSRLAAIEDRLGQTLAAIDELNARVSTHVSTFIFMVGFAVVALAGFWIYTQIFERRRPPELMQYAPVPVRIADETVMLGVGLYKWPIPEKLVAQLAEEERNVYEQKLEELQILQERIIKIANEKGIDLREPAPQSSDTSKADQSKASSK